MLTGKKLCPLGLWIGTAALLSGCVARQISLAGPGRPPAVKTSTYASADYKQDVKEYEVNLEGEDDPVTARHLRDKIAYGLMSDIDEVYGQFTDHLYAGKATAQF